MKNLNTLVNKDPSMQAKIDQLIRDEFHLHNPQFYLANVDFGNDDRPSLLDNIVKSSVPEIIINEI